MRESTSKTWNNTSGLLFSVILLLEVCSDSTCVLHASDSVFMQDNPQLHHQALSWHAGRCGDEDTETVILEDPLSVVPIC